MSKLKTQKKNNNTLSVTPKYKYRFFNYLIGCFALSLFVQVTPAVAQVNPRCLTPQYDSLLAIKYPALIKSRQDLNRLLQRAQTERKTSASRTEAEETIIIPVVVHVVHNNASGTIGGSGNGNITNEQISSQIDVLNEDYRRKKGTNAYNTSPVGADVNIEFRLAQVDPEGNVTGGITRTYDSKASFDVYADDEYLKSLIYWPSDRYLNIWVTSLKNKYLGYSQFPDGCGTPGLADIGGLAKTDGVVINHANFGRRTGTVTSGVYKDGRTTTHEIAHWLGLLHTWGDEDCGDDYCEDTPQISGPNNSTSCPETTSECTGTPVRNMIENYLDYSPDQCMNTFTQDQKNRIRSVLEVSPRRRELVKNASLVLQSKDLADLRLSPNPTDDVLDIKLNPANRPDQVSVEVINMLGKVVLTARYTDAAGAVSLDVRTLTSGVYFVRVTTPDKISSARFVIKRNS